MRIGTANIRNFPDMRESYVVEDALKMCAVADLWGMQENNPKEDSTAIMEKLGEDWEIIGARTDIPFFYRRSLLRLMGMRIQLMPFSPVLPLTPRPRNLVGCIWKIRGRSVPPWVTVNCHMIAGAYNGDVSESDRKRRVRQWDIEWNYTVDFVRDYRRKGYTVFLLGDFNHPRPPKPMPNWQWLVGQRLDRVGCSSVGTVDVDEIAEGTVELNSDHDGQWTRVLFNTRIG